MGWVSEELSPLSRQFIAFCSPTRLPVLDIGAATGLATLAALETGAVVIANDLDITPLEAHAHPCLVLRPGRFPKDLHFDPESLGAVHASSVFHFLTGNQLQQGIRAIARWLAPGGKLFLQSATPYQAPFAAFIPEYERRLAAKVKWPGWIEKVSTYSTHRKLGAMPRSLHLLDDQVLARLCESAGLTVEQAELTRRPDLPQSLYLDGRETLVLIATRPALQVSSLSSPISFSSS